MSFHLKFNTSATQEHGLDVNLGEVLFILGANGTGKSTLVRHFSSQYHGSAIRVSAHRQTWIDCNSIEMTQSTKVETERDIQYADQDSQSLYRDDYGGDIIRLTIYELINSKIFRALTMAKAHDEGDREQYAKAAEEEDPVATINELLQESNIPVKIVTQEHEILASKNDSPKFSVAKLSDGERNALLLAGRVLTAPKGTLLIIDEPERHLHRAIISPLLCRLFERRPDCSFVISTHDHDLPLMHPEAHTLILRSCTISDSNATYWDADELPADSPIDDNVKHDLLGARRKVLFVEGTENSLDKALYAILFPMVSVIPKGSCHDVETAVAGARSADSLHWLSTYGIVDGDGLPREVVDAKRRRGVYALPYYSVEALYYHPQVILWIAERVASLQGLEVQTLAADAMSAALAKVRGHTKRLSKKSAMKLIRRSVIEQIPNDDALLNYGSRELRIDVNSDKIQQEVREALESAVEEENWEEVAVICPIRESGALKAISSVLQFPSEMAYERTVRHMLSKREDARNWMRRLFGDLSSRVIE